LAPFYEYFDLEKPKPKPETEQASAPDPMADLYNQFLNMKKQGIIPQDMDFESFKDLIREQSKGGIMDVMPRDMAKFGGLKKIFKKATNVVKDVVKSDIGKAALLGAAAFGVPGTQFGGLFGRAGLGGQATGLFGSKGIGATLFGTPASTVFNPNASFSSSTPGFFQKALNTLKGGSLSNLIPETAMGRAGAVAAIGGLTGFLAGQGKSTEEIEAIMDRPESLKPYLKQYYLNLNPDLKDTMEGEAAAEEFAQSQMGEYGYQNKAYGGRMMKALGDTAQMASGIEGLPLRQNPMGTNEIDLRETGGFIPPVGIKEKADDIPAMLSNNEFVFTADAVRGMGGGDVNLGAQRMYDMMKKLENGGRV
ncbi:MAG: hypothetical protein ACO3H5_07735, partial [Candidatus Nanopelagicales bacterium]